jgi:hypothetical protein
MAAQTNTYVRVCFFAKVIDPWAGSYLMECLTDELYEAAEKIIEEVTALFWVIQQYILYTWTGTSGQMEH